MTSTLPNVPPGAPGSLLSAGRRLAEMDSAADGVVDVLVIGGGITGVGVALDAATRGLSVVLCERQDLAYGTSRWSSKLVHGGLRYLAGGQVGIAWESATERARLMSVIAPHLTHPMAQILPITDDVSAPLVTAGLAAADVMRRLTGSTLPSPRRISGEAARRWAPGLRASLAHASLSWDGQLIDDARLVVSVARTAAAYGAKILTHCAVTVPDVGLADITDVLTGQRWQIRPRRVINATGAWADEVDPRVHLVRSRGTHLVVAAESLGNPAAAIAAPIPGSTTRFVFALPQPDGLAFVGLTDVETDAPLDAPAADDDEVEFLLSTLNTVLAVPLTASDVRATFSGYRPLLADPGRGSADLSRRHAVIDGDIISVVGGKLTTYRRMASDAVDLISDRPCRTHELPLVGASPWVGDEVRLRRRFGAEADVVARRARHQGELVPIGDTPVLPVELLWATTAEGAITEDDVLDRRLRLDIAPWWRDEVVSVLPEMDLTLRSSQFSVSS